MADKKRHICPRCNATAEASRSPRGWHTDADGVLICGDCFSRAYRSVCVSIPIAGPFPHTQTPEPSQALRAAVIGAFDRSTRLANWAITELLRHEPPRAAGQRLAPLTVGLYQCFGASPLRAEWDGATQSANAILRSAEQKYRAARSAIQGTFSASAQNFRWPFPYPVPKQSWSLRIESEQRALSLTLPEVGRQDVRLLGGHHTRRHQAILRQVIDGQAIGGELRLCAISAPSNIRRHVMQVRLPGGGQTQPKQIVVRMSAYVPRTNWSGRTGLTMRVSTGAESLLYAECEGDTEPWRYHGDHIRRWVIASRAMRQRWSDDTKAEHRMPRRKFNRRLQAADVHNEKYRHRLDGAADELAANVVNYASRRGVSTIIYDDSVRDFCPDFAYAGLAALILRKSGDRGIEVLASEEVPTETPDPLENETPSA